MRNFEKVKEDIRAGRTELVWEELYSFLDAKIEGNIYFTIDRYDLHCGIWKWDNDDRRNDDRRNGDTKQDHPLFKLINKEDKRTDMNIDWPKIAETLEETKAKLQELYNDYLLDEAKKLDQNL